MLLNHSPSFILGPRSSHNNEFPARLGQQCTQSLPIGDQLQAEKKMSKNPRLSSPIFVFEFRNFVTSPPAISTTVQFILLCTESTLSHSHTPIILLIPRWLTFAKNGTDYRVYIFIIYLSKALLLLLLLLLLPRTHGGFQSNFHFLAMTLLV